jgi:hypothetical protein
MAGLFVFLALSMRLAPGAGFLAAPLRLRHQLRIAPLLTAVAGFAARVVSLTLYLGHKLVS